MFEELYFQMYEIEMISGEIRRARHFLESASKGEGFYSQVAAILIEALDRHMEPEDVEESIMKLEGDENEKKAIYFRFLYSFNRYDVNLPFYDSKRCGDT